MVRLLTVLLLALACLPAEAQLARTLDALLDDPDFEDAFWGVHVVDLATGETLYARNERRHFIPASTMKLLTTAAALDRLGPGFRYTTTLYMDGERTGSALDGHLVVRGSGDPTIGDRRFTSSFPTDGDPLAVFRGWADSLAQRGVTSVTGHVIGDDRVFDGLLLGNGWAWDDEPTPFAAQISGLTFNEGRLHVSVTGTSAGRPGRVSIEPETEYVYVANRSRTTNGSTRNALRRDPGSNTLWIETEVPAGQSVRRTVSVHNPTGYFVHALRDALRSRGLTVEGDPIDVDDWYMELDYGRMVPVATHTSPPLSVMAALTNKDSQNLYAEHLLRTLGAEFCAEAQAARATVECGSAAAGLLVAEPLFERAGMRTDRMRLRDGSGMSPYNMVSPSDLTALLQTMWAHPDPAVREAFVSSLAVGGIDGTIERRFTTGPSRANVRAKTGTVTGARNLSGYVTTADGRTLAFALLANQFGTSVGAITRAQDALVDAMARSRR